MANRPPRLPGFSYLGPNRYFLTICARTRSPVLSNREVGEFVVQQILLIASEQSFEVIAYCVMPDHVHFLIQGITADAHLIRMMHAWKQATGHWWKQRGHPRPLWQRGYHDRILREDDPTEGVVQYIVSNPLRAGLVRDVRDYPMLGSGAYDLDALMAAAWDWKPWW
jgi:putative transposase